MVLIVKRLNTWLRKGWETPSVALQYDQLSWLITLAVGVFIAVKSTPIVVSIPHR